MDFQENDTNALNELIDMIADIKGLKYKPSDYIAVTLIPPVVLILQLIEMTLSSVGNIASVFQNMGITIDAYFFLQQYVPHIDWDKFKEKSSIKKVEDKTRNDITTATGGDASGGGVF